MSARVVISQVHPGGQDLVSGQAVVTLNDLPRGLDDGRLRIYDEARKQYLQANGRFDDTAQLLEVENVFNDTSTGAAHIVIGATLAASVDPDSVVTVEVPAAGLKERVLWPELVVGEGPGLPAWNGPSHSVRHGEGGTGGGNGGDEEERGREGGDAASKEDDTDGTIDGGTVPPVGGTTAGPGIGLGGNAGRDTGNPRAAGPGDRRTGTGAILLSLLAGAVIGALVAWFALPPGDAGGVADAQAELARLQTELRTARDRAGNAEDSLARAESDREAAEQELAEAQARAEDAERQLEDARQQLGQDESAAIDRAVEAEAERDLAIGERDDALAAASDAEARAEDAEARADEAEATLTEAAERADEAEETLAATRQALQEETRRADAAEAEAEQARADARETAERQGEDDDARVRAAEDRARAAETEAERARDRLAELEAAASDADDRIGEAQDRIQQAEEARDAARAERDRALERADAAERQLADLRASQTRPAFPMDAQRALCGSNRGIFQVVRTFATSDTTVRLNVSDQQELSRLMCDAEIPCPEAFERVLGAGHADNSGAVAVACRF